jgi:hypothetical protein
MDLLSRRRLWLKVGLLLLAGGWLALAASGFVFGPFNRAIIGLELGLAFGQATLAACWLALGTGPTWVRVATATFWVVALAVAWFTHPNGDVLLIGVSIGVQWLLVQAPLWVLRLARGVRIQPIEELTALDPARPQFGIRQLMVLTACVAVVLGIGRVVMPLLVHAARSGNWGEWPAFAFVVATNVVLTLPLALAALLPRYWLWACGVALVFIAGATVVELSLLRYFLPGNGPLQPGVLALFVIMNGSQACVVIAALGNMRAAGYRLA